MGIRRLAPDAFLSVDASSVDPISFNDFKAAFRIIRPSVSPERCVCVCVCVCVVVVVVLLLADVSLSKEDIERSSCPRPAIRTCLVSLCGDGCGSVVGAVCIPCELDSPSPFCLGFWMRIPSPLYAPWLRSAVFDSTQRGIRSSEARRGSQAPAPSFRESSKSQITAHYPITMAFHELDSIEQSAFWGSLLSLIFCVVIICEC